MTAPEAWEYVSIVVASMAPRQLTETLNNAGAKGWEVVGLTDNDPTMGTNSILAVVKRKIVPFEPPTDLSAGWKTDPSDRHQHRLWDGECWTFSVANSGDESRDPPTRLTPANRQQ